MHDVVARWRARAVGDAGGFPLPDLVLAAAFCLVAVVSVLTGNPDEGPVAVTLPVAVVSAAALAWRRRSGVVAVGLLVVSGGVQTAASRSPGSLWALAVYAIVMYSVAAHYPEGRAAVAGAVLVAALLVEERVDNGVDYLFILLLFGGIWLLGRASRSWRARVSSAERRERDAARLAVAEERLRIARDLHDVVAHSLSVIAVQSDAAEAALERDATRALEPVRAIRSTARASLSEIRSLLDVLRSDDAERPGTDSPGISAIDGLVASARAAGVPVDYRAGLSDAAVSPAVDLAAYRIVQECLTNVIKHAGRASTVVELRQSDRALRICVANAAPTQQAGGAATPVAGGEVAGPAGGVSSSYGLVGIRERVHALHGELVRSTTADGGFEVAVTIPLAAHRERVGGGAT